MPNAVPQDLVNMAAAFTGLPMGDLIGGPLMAAAKAQKELAEIGTKYILETGFYAETVPNSGTPGKIKYVQRNLEFEVSRPVIQVDNKGNVTTLPNSTSTLVVPLLSCVPIQSLGVTTVDISFDMEVKSSYSNTDKLDTQQKTEAGGSFSAKAGWGPISVEIKGSASYSSSSNRSQEESFQKSNNAHYHVEVTATQQPVPKGLQNIIDTLTQNISPIMVPASEPPAPPAPSPSPSPSPGPSPSPSPGP